MKKIKILITCALAQLLFNSALADVTYVKDNGFESVNKVRIMATPEVIYKTLTSQVHLWWNSDHTWSGDANNMSIDATAGGCFCEKLVGGGSVKHLEVVFAQPPLTLRMSGALGPLQQFAIAGAQTWEIKAIDKESSELILTYRVTGTLEKGLSDWAAPVDFVHNEQLQRLKRLLETGSADIIEKSAP
ncbi:SRPBCC family protein [Thalassotalea agarivorans]|uniref:Polyketide cyclase / dehydrase and lipid transport n=1 Tax=Thalassotalea agarivorans TaxID=349064 RepID=A0A1I0FHK6_THASX|nr:hypothetical protein [Thalassotalea agarivorans]SET57511.1 hypothetical protein SAMN05660429_02132 [Thalassotalea agarivorans]